MRDEFLEEFSDKFWDTEDASERRDLIDAYLEKAQGDDERRAIGAYYEVVLKQEGASKQ